MNPVPAHPANLFPRFRRLLNLNQVPICRDAGWLESQRNRTVEGVFVSRVVDDRRIWRRCPCFEVHQRPAPRAHERTWFAYAFEMMSSQAKLVIIVLWSYFALYTLATMSLYFAGRPALAWWWTMPVFLWPVVVCVALHKASPRARVCKSLQMCTCPTCRYSIGSLPTQDDGCTLCPECGAAWILPPTKPKPVSHVADASSPRSGRRLVATGDSRWWSGC